MIARRCAALLSLVVIAACESDPSGPGEDGVATLTVDTNPGWAYVRFEGDEAIPVVVSDPRTSDAWDIGFFSIAATLNGGAAGPGAVTGHCICQNEAATDAQVVAFTAESELAEFEEVTAADIPTDAEAWTSDALVPAIDGWYAYNPALHAVAAVPENTWYVRSASGTAYAKLHVTALAGSTQEHAGRVTIEFAVRPTQAAPYGPTQVLEIDLAGGIVDLDLETGAIVSGSSNWDLRFSGYDIRLNGGVSGSGQAAAGLTTAPFESIVSVPPVASAFTFDGFGGVFDEHSWYRYDLLGNNLIHPTFDIFLIQADEGVYKVQVIGYYSTAGVSRHVTFRYERLED